MPWELESTCLARGQMHGEEWHDCSITRSPWLYMQREPKHTREHRKMQYLRDPHITVTCSLYGVCEFRRAIASRGWRWLRPAVLPHQYEQDKTNKRWNLAWANKKTIKRKSGSKCTSNTSTHAEHHRRAFYEDSWSSNSQNPDIVVHDYTCGWNWNRKTDKGWTRRYKQLWLWGPRWSNLAAR